jgi:hypothetical protein
LVIFNFHGNQHEPPKAVIDIQLAAIVARHCSLEWLGMVDLGKRTTPTSPG